MNHIIYIYIYIYIYLIVGVGFGSSFVFGDDFLQPDPEEFDALAWFLCLVLVLMLAVIWPAFAYFLWRTRHRM